jgi:hypothetical protein
MDNESDKTHEADGMNGPSTSSTRGGQARLGGFGDDQGTRVGHPDAPKRAQGGSGEAGTDEARLSSSSTSEGIEGAILEGDDSTRGNG